MKVGVIYIYIYIHLVYFIAKGRVRMVDKEGYIYRTYVEGSFFGEFEVLNRRVTYIYIYIYIH